MPINSTDLTPSRLPIDMVENVGTASSSTQNQVRAVDFPERASRNSTGTGEKYVIDGNEPGLRTPQENKLGNEMSIPFRYAPGLSKESDTTMNAADYNSGNFSSVPGREDESVQPTTKPLKMPQVSKEARSLPDSSSWNQSPFNVVVDREGDAISREGVSSRAKPINQLPLTGQDGQIFSPLQNDANKIQTSFNSSDLRSVPDYSSDDSRSSKTTTTILGQLSSSLQNDNNKTQSTFSSSDSKTAPEFSSDDSWSSKTATTILGQLSSPLQTDTNKTQDAGDFPSASSGSTKTVNTIEDATESATSGQDYAVLPNTADVRKGNKK